jgi:hypothetical protein
MLQSGERGQEGDAAVCHAHKTKEADEPLSNDPLGWVMRFCHTITPSQAEVLQQEGWQCLCQTHFHGYSGPGAAGQGVQ